MAGDALPEGWRWSTLGEVADPGCRAIVSGPFGSNIGSRFFVEQGVPVIRGNNLTTDTSRFLDRGFVFVTEDKADELGNCDAVVDDIVFTAAGSLGQVGIIPETANYPRYIISNKQLRARVDKRKVDPLFAFYWFSSKEMVEYVQQRNTGSSVPLINLSVLRSLPLPVPPLSEQRAIAHILGILDDKIELNRRMNETLEAMARALFQSWFVDFDPVRAKAEGGDPCSLKEIAEFFPSRFEDSKLGQIPAGWEVGRLEDIASVTMGLSPDGTTYNVDGFGTPLINGPVEFGDHFPVKTKWTTSPTRLAQVGDLILCVRGSTTGRRVVADDSYCLGRGVCAIRAGRHARTFVYQTVNTAIDRLLSKTTGSVFPNLSAPDIKEFPILNPTTQVVEAFDHIAEPLTRRAEANVRQSRTLAALRDALLPKLISGELRVKDARRFVDGVDVLDEVDGG